MNLEKWEKIKDDLEEKFEIEKADIERLDDAGGTDIEFIIFKAPMGRMKLEFIARPIVLDKKVIYSNRIGSEPKVEYIYSKNDKNFSIKVYKWNEDEDSWMEIKSDAFL